MQLKSTLRGTYVKTMRTLNKVVFFILGDTETDSLTKRNLGSQELLSKKLFQCRIQAIFSHKNSLNQISVAWVMHGLTTLRPFRMRRLLAMTEPCQGWGITFSSCMTGVSSFFTVLPRRNTKSTGPRAAQQSLNDYKHLLLISRSLAILLMFKGNDK